MDQRLDELIVSLYSANFRAYHSYAHIQRMIDTVSINHIQLTDAQVMAVKMHDIIYMNPPPPDGNEVTSAELAKRVLEKFGYDQDFRELVACIIEDTEFHLATIPDSAIVIDLDLWELGTVRYWKNRLLIRQEFKVSNAQFKEGRRKWIQGMLDRDSIFLTDIPGKMKERVAQKNLQTELRMINGS